MNSNQLASYKNANYTLQKTKQIVLLYDAAIRFTRQAKQAIEEQDFGLRFELMQKVSNILAGLHSSLDFEQGGEISKVLSSFYTGLDLRIFSLNRTNNLDECDYIVNELKNMRDSWEKIDQQYGVEVGSSPIQSPTTAQAAAAQMQERVTEGADFSA
jgi:flagellar protein FliS